MPLPDDSLSDPESDSEELLEELSSELECFLASAVSLCAVSCFDFLGDFFADCFGDRDLLGDLVFGLLSSGDVRLSAFLGLFASAGGLLVSCRRRFLFISSEEADRRLLNLFSSLEELRLGRPSSGEESRRDRLASCLGKFSCSCTFLFPSLSREALLLSLICSCSGLEVDLLRLLSCTSLEGCSRFAGRFSSEGLRAPVCFPFFPATGDFSSELDLLARRLLLPTCSNSLDRLPRVLSL